MSCMHGSPQCHVRKLLSTEEAEDDEIVHQACLINSFLVVRYYYDRVYLILIIMIS